MTRATGWSNGLFAGFRHFQRGHGGDITSREDTTMDKDLDQAKGRIKQAAGDLTDNDDLKREGKADENAGKAKEFLGDVKDKLDDAVDKAKDGLKRD